MSRPSKLRQATQTHTCRAVLAKYLEGEQLEAALIDLRDAMRTGPQAWAFKKAEDLEPSSTD